ncbi:CG9065 [Drosophila busckii]|uniref:Cytochrome c oxidase copper chaperone n=1 Tax=Drosophila busckii TaxID=30019 RepID=A0A0M5J8F5_DROBS|nr:cytochrome c oxidase copper chaperone [Drosophila busckii]ALC49756.1 CG9065 [Drosophila busckii]
MGSNTSKAVVETAAIPTTGAGGEKPKCKACCACPETKRVRDACIVENGEENCTALIEAHKKCMREAGFQI